MRVPIINWSGRWSLALPVLLVLACLLTGCASRGAGLPAVTTLFDDQRFAAGAALPPTFDGATLFAVSPAMRAYLERDAFRTQLRQRGKEQGLVAALYDAGELQLEYEGAATRTATEAFAARRGNCLSLVLMTAAFAKALGLAVRFNEVVVDDSWQRTGELMVYSGHVNLSLGHRVVGQSSTDPLLTIDFLPGTDVTGYHSHEVAESTIVAMYWNNRAVEAMVAGQLLPAYAYARAALLADASFGPSYNTLAVVYQRHGDPDLAERSWRQALAREPENAVVLRNLAALLATAGRAAEADALSARAAAIEPYPPFHFFRLGMAAMARHDYPAARTLFEREVRRAPFHDEFHFWLGMALLRLGDMAEARTQVALAQQTSTTGTSRQLYSAKLELMKQGRAGQL